MARATRAIPEGYEGAIPYLCVKGATAGIEFYKKAFGAKESMRLAAPDGKIGHVEITIGDARVMLADEYPDMNVLSPKSIGGSPVTIHIYVGDVDALAARAVAAGAKVVQPVEDKFYGDRAGKLEDPFGHLWWFATHKEDMSPEEIGRRAAVLFGGS
jgi:PhnB protein